MLKSLKKSCDRITVNMSSPCQVKYDAEQYEMFLYDDNEHVRHIGNIEPSIIFT